MVEPAEALLIRLPFVFLAVLAAIVGLRLVTGSIATRGLLSEAGGGPTSALRVQMMMATAVAAATYAASIAQATDMSALPPIDPRLVALVGGSNLLVVGRRAALSFLGFLRAPR